MSLRYGIAVLAVAAYVLLCGTVWYGRRRRRAEVGQAGNVEPDAILVAFASQTGTAEWLARQTVASLLSAGVPARLVDLAHVDHSLLQTTSRMLFVVSTIGEGDAPDPAAAFVRHVLGRSAALPSLHYGVLALGDRDYRHFCAFGHRLDAWLRQVGATPLFDLVEVDNEDDGALRHWQHQLGVATGHTGMADWRAPRYAAWTLVEREHVNAGSAGGACYRLVLRPPEEFVHWDAGDIAEIGPRHPTADAASPPLPHREYSIASLPEEGAIQLLVRRFETPDGELGIGSGWLTQHARIGGRIDLRVRRNANFRAPADARPLILIGNGTGIAGLRALLARRVASRHRRNWLLFGERNAACDFHFGDDIAAWRAEGHLERLDVAFSRDQPERVYVQHALRAAAEMLCAWVDAGAAIYVCGSLAGMAPGVHAVLCDVLGGEQVATLQAQGRYRRDVY